MTIYVSQVLPRHLIGEYRNNMNENKMTSSSFILDYIDLDCCYQGYMFHIKFGFNKNCV